jgi:hypothetical protein
MGSMIRRFAALVLCLMVGCGVCEAQVTCTNANDTRMDRVYFQLDMNTDRPFDGNGLLAVFSPDSRKQLAKVSERMWSLDLRPVGTQFLDPITFGQLATVKLDRVGWLFTPRSSVPPRVALERPDGVERCAAWFEFTATPARRVRVRPNPRDLVVPVTCPRQVCGSNRAIELLTEPVAASEDIRMTMHFGNVCDYVLEIPSYATLTEVKELTLGMLLQRCNSLNVATLRTRGVLKLTVPRGVLVILESPAAR